MENLAVKSGVFFFFMPTYTLVMIKRLFFVLAVCLFGWPSLVQAQEDVRQNNVQVEFPERVIFNVETAVNLQSATLIYDVRKFECLPAETAIEVDVNGNQARWEWVLSRSGNPPPGVEMWWQWELETVDGQTITTPRQTYTFTDERYEWRTLNQEGITLHWYGADAVGRDLLSASVASMTRLEEEMGITLESRPDEPPINIFIYSSSDDMREALLYVQAWAGGVAFNEYNTILMGVAPSQVSGWGENVVPHELAHLIIGQFGRSCVGGDRPTWLDEGLAMVAEGEQLTRVKMDIQTAVNNNSFEPLRSLTGSFSAHGTEAGVAYSQSYSVVNFMLEAYGGEKMRQLILVLADGESYDDALVQVYGLNMDELELEWRASLGLPAREIPATSTPLSGEAIPTLAPLAPPKTVITPASADAPPPSPPANTNPSSFCGLVLFPLALLGVWIPRRKK